MQDCRKKRIGVRISEHEYEMLQQIVQHDEYNSVSELIRTLINDDIYDFESWQRWHAERRICT